MLIGRPVNFYFTRNFIVLTTRQRILEAADELFGKMGFDAATTRQIAEISGTNKALIHYHFRNKDDLFVAVLARYYEQLSAAVLTVLSEQGSIRDRFLRVIDVYVDFLTANLTFSHMVQREAAGGRHLNRVVAHMTPLFQGATEVLQQAFPNATSDDMSPPQVLVSFYGMIISYFTYSPVLEPLIGADPFSDANLARRKQHLAKMMDLVIGELEAE